jgi:hypothetical protein
MDIRSVAKDVQQFLGIAQGAQFVWAVLGLGTVVGGLSAGALALYSALPWWSIVLTGVGAAFLTAGLLSRAASTVADRRKPRATPAYVALTGVIESGMRLAARIRAEATAPETTAEDKAPWVIRLKDWATEAEMVLDDVAPDRLAAFRADILIADTGRTGAPHWISGELTDLDLQIERLRNIRASS